jgi:hypothetical protein
VADITRVTAILERSNDPNVRQALRYAQRAWVQLDQQNPASTLREEARPDLDAERAQEVQGAAQWRQAVRRSETGGAGASGSRVCRRAQTRAE